MEGCENQGKRRGGRLRRFARAGVILLVALAAGAGLFVLLGGFEFLAVAQLESVLYGRIDAPDLDAGLTLVSLRKGRLWEDGHPEHRLIYAEEAEADVDPLALSCPCVRIRGGILAYRERIDTAFVRPVSGPFPRFELLDTTVTLAGRTVLHGEEAILTRDDARLFSFRGRGLTHREIRLDEIALRLTEIEGGVDVPAVWARGLGGTATASLVISESGSFEGGGRVTGVDLDRLSDLLGPPWRGRLAGRLGGEMSVAGRGDEFASLRAAGSVRIEGLSIRRSPALLSLAALLLGAHRSGGPFDRAWARIEILGPTLHLHDAEISGPGWGLRVRGEVRLEDREVDLLVEPIPPVGGHRRLLLPGRAYRRFSDAVRQRIWRARIRGGYDDVHVVPTWIESLGDRISGIFD